MYVVWLNDEEAYLTTSYLDAMHAAGKNYCNPCSSTADAIREGYDGKELTIIDVDDRSMPESPFKATSAERKDGDG